MQSSDRWEFGRVIVLQEVWDGKLWSARPVRVVEDRPDLLALWCPEGTPVKGPSAPWRPGRSAGPAYFVAMFTHRDWGVADFVWPTTNLMLIRPGEWYGTWVSWTREGEPMGWYVNFQRPVRRTTRGIQTMDLMLDLIVDQDRSLHWKDEDEFAALTNPGLIGESEAAQVREAARHVPDTVAQNKPPFGEPWHEWQPDPGWEVPTLPEGWDVV
ncbi:MAG TPA: DUF402 domain-containing protein [Chloroflexota bacterium]|nr:DUF402 domain-containing protein [Chloroflexota bacterium]